MREEPGWHRGTHFSASSLTGRGVLFFCSPFTVHCSPFTVRGYVKMSIERFEDIRAWRKARELTHVIYSITKESQFSKDFRLRDQIRSAAASIMANIAEGFDSRSNVEFIRFLGYARRSASEVQSHLYIALDEGYITQEQFHSAYQLAEESKSLIGGFIRYLSKHAEVRDRQPPSLPNREP